jgi:hypothetical protein
VGTTVAALCEAEQLPGLLDVRAIIAPVQPALVRRVPGHNLWVWYDLPDDAHVRLLTVTRTPPDPVD